MTTETLLIVLAVLALFLGLLAIRFHVGLSLMVAGLVGIVLMRGTDAAVSTVANQPFSTSADYSLTIIPLFILMGVFAVHARLAQAGFDLAARVLRRLPGGSALASLAGSGLFAAVTGSSVATVATMARVSTDAIVKAGHGIRLAAGVVCAGGTLGVLIPPSIVLVLYGVVTGESIGELLLAGLGPGLLTILLYGITIVLMVLVGRRRRARENTVLEREPAMAGGVPSSPSAGAGLPEAAEETGASGGTRQDRPDLFGFMLLVVIFMVSIGTIYLGVATATEAASFGAVSAFVILLIRTRPPRWARAIKESVTEAVGLTAMTFLLMAGAGVFTYFLALSGASTAVVDAVLAADLEPYVVLVLCLLLLLPLGMFLDGISMILVAAPLLHPILSGYGFEGLWLGVLIVKVAEMALITPPVGMNAFVYSGAVPEAGLGRVFRGIVPFIVADLVVVAILILVPDIVTFIPELSSAK
ncbi:TRAP transporter large permease [Nocardiopsis alba]|uniref:TRAP transporter large permease subunit n=2 Tax=Nocardiopsis alba TaxID=53437 RepID=A0A7K2IVV3_9ACTN|nr:MULTISPECIES: TRAP transporter large permease subunit [Nocardiopsis]AFR10951.1 dctM-like transporters family protein [Nocardiopsis alba ATCC BAA-2165]MEC3894304.1 TRAP transporter large permease subunit [Nocardiopsis sp. LDBS1602]MYR34091.1 TRAP transporter large permease subunit [Nocardiopsis alba]